MTPLLQHLLKLQVTTSLVKVEHRKGAQKIQEVYYVTEKVSPTDEVWEHEEVVEEHAEVLYEEDVATLGKTVVLLSEVDVLSTTEKASQRDKKSELRGEISVTDTSKRITKHKVAPKTQETSIIFQESDTERVVTTVEEKPRKEKTEEEFFVRTIESPTEEVTDERRDSISVTQDISKQETGVKTVRKGREMTIKTESKGRQVIQQEIRKTEEIVADQTKPSPVIITAEARKQTEKLEFERTFLTEVTHEESVDHDDEIISAPPEEKYSRTEEVTEIRIDQRGVTVKDEQRKVQVKMIDEETSRKDESQITLPVIDSKKDETSAPRKVPVKKHEVAEKKTDKKPKPDDIAETKEEKVAEKPKPKVDVTPKVKTKESVTDIELKETVLESVVEKTEPVRKKKEDTKYVPPQREDAENKKEDILIEVQAKTSIPSRPEEKKRIPPQTPSRGTKRKSNITIISILNFSYDSMSGCTLFFFIQNHQGSSPHLSLHTTFSCSL